MKQGVHPEYNAKCKVTCACGHSFITGSTAKEIQVEICSACHPFFTGKQKLLDTAGRVDKFRERMEAARQKEAASAKRAAKVKEARHEAKEAAVAAQFGNLKDLAKAAEQLASEAPAKKTPKKSAAKKVTKKPTAKKATKKLAPKIPKKKGGVKK